MEAGEGRKVEFKSTFRWDLRQAKKNEAITHASLKTIAAFLNTDGVDQVADDKSAVGIEVDDFERRQVPSPFLQVIKASMRSTPPRWFRRTSTKKFASSVQASPRPVYIRASGKVEFFVEPVRPVNASGRVIL